MQKSLMKKLRLEHYAFFQSSETISQLDDIEFESSFQQPDCECWRHDQGVIDLVQAMAGQQRRVSLEG